VVRHPSAERRPLPAALGVRVEANRDIYLPPIPPGKERAAGRGVTQVAALKSRVSPSSGLAPDHFTTSSEATPEEARTILTTKLALPSKGTFESLFQAADSCPAVALALCWGTMASQPRGPRALEAPPTGWTYDCRPRTVAALRILELRNQSDPRGENCQVPAGQRSFRPASLLLAQIPCAKPLGPPVLHGSILIVRPDEPTRWPITF